MTRGEIELIADTLLIQKIVMMDYGIHKSAGMADDMKGMLGEGASVISDGVKTMVDTSSTSSAVDSIGNMIATGALFKLWWPLAIINTVASTVFGVNVITIAKKIWSAISGKIESGEPVSPAEVTDATKAVTSELAASAALADPFRIIRLADQQGKLFKLIKSGYGRSYGRSGFFDWLRGLRRNVGRSLIGSFVGWALKFALLGAGLLAVSGVAANLLGLKPKADEAQPSGATYEDNATTPTIAPAESTPGGLTPTGNGQAKHNQGGAKWIVPIVGGSVQNMLLNWAAYVYQEFQDKSKWPLISSTASFNRMANQLRQAEESGSNQLTMPKEYISIKQVVDQFAGEASTKIKG